MKTTLLAVLFASLAAASLPTAAQVDVRIGIGLPPPIVFARPPELVVIPETYVYAVPASGGQTNTSQPNPAIMNAAPTQRGMKVDL